NRAFIVVGAGSEGRCRSGGSAARLAVLSAGEDAVLPGGAAALLEGVALARRCGRHARRPSTSATAARATVSTRAPNAAGTTCARVGIGMVGRIGRVVLCRGVRARVTLLRIPFEALGAADGTSQACGQYPPKNRNAPRILHGPLPPRGSAAAYGRPRRRRASM